MRRAAQRGATLGIVLLLLLGLALLALAGHGAAMAALAIAGLEQHAARAFEAAEAGVSRTLRAWHSHGATAVPVTEPVWPDAWPEITNSRSVAADPPGQPGAWPDGFSLGSDGFVSRHYTVVSESRGGRRAAARIEQGFVIIEPAP